MDLNVQRNKLRFGGALREVGTTRTYSNADKEGSTNEYAPRQTHACFLSRIVWERQLGAKEVGDSDRALLSADHVRTRDLSICFRFHSSSD
jgi:hypothetical protein